MKQKTITHKSTNTSLLPVPHQYVGVEKNLIPLGIFQTFKAQTAVALLGTWAVFKGKGLEFLNYDHYADKVTEAYNLMQFDLLLNRVYVNNNNNNTFVNRESFQRLNEPQQTDSEILSRYSVKNIPAQLIAQSIAQEYLEVITQKLPNSCRLGTKTGYSIRHNLTGLTTIVVSVLQDKELTFIQMTYQEARYKVYLLILKTTLSVLWYLTKITLAYWALCLYQTLYSLGLLTWTLILGIVWIWLCLFAELEKRYSQYENKYLHTDMRPTLHVLSGQQKEYQDQYKKLSKTIDGLNKAKGFDNEQ